MAFLASDGDVKASIVQIACILIAAAIYAPFVMVANHQQSAEE